MTTIAEAYEKGYQDGQHVASEECGARIEDLENEVESLTRERDQLVIRLSSVTSVQEILAAECNEMRDTLADICAHNYCDEDCPLFVSEGEPCRIAGHGGGDCE